MSTPIQRRDMAQAIVDFEARRDNKGHLVVYNLPANDGGGRFEVAGINERYNPAALNQIRTLLQAGYYAEAEAFAVEFVAKYTDVAATWTNIPAIESYLRDCVFNRGARGAARILQRAVKVDDDGAVGPATKAAMSRVRPQELLVNLRAAREQYERVVVGYRANFWNGLVNRWNGAEKTAAKFGFDAPAEKTEAPVPSPIPTANNAPAPVSVVGRPWWVSLLEALFGRKKVEAPAPVPTEPPTAPAAKPVMLILRGIAGHFDGKDWPGGALYEEPARQYAAKRGYEPVVLDVSGETGPDSAQVKRALAVVQANKSITALYGFSGGGYNIWHILAALTADERTRFALIVVLGAPNNPRSLYAGPWELVYRIDPPAGHMAGPAALLAEISPAAPTEPASGKPAWFTWAEHEVGFHERGENLGIERYIDAAHCGSLGDPWCAIFANAGLESSGLRGTRSAMARSFEHDSNFVRLSAPAIGAITTMWRGSPSAGTGHVFYYAGENDSGVLALGGNQDDQVCRQFEPRSRIVGYFWPKSVPLPKVGPVRVAGASGAVTKET